MINFRFITNIIGKLLLVESAFLMICIIVALIYGESDTMAFVYSSAITLAAGSLMAFTVKVKDRVLAKKDGYFIVTSTWVMFTIFGCLPFLLSGTIPSIPDAIFETMSGFTTTGSSVVNDIEALPHATLFWRSLTQWMGGMGIIVLLLAILPGLGIEGRDLFVAEVPGPTHDKFTATFTSTARRMWYLYMSLTAAQTILLLLGNMDLFDAICHSFTTMATGGYSTKQDSLAYWNSAYIQYVVTIFMFIAGTNFGLMYIALHGKIRKMFRDEEFRLYFFITLIASAIIACVLYFKGYDDLELSIREALFQVVSIITTTGFATADYLLWPPLLGVIIFVLLFIGACAGSTSGGLKCIRLNLLFKNSFIEMKRIIHPNGIINVKYNGKSIHPNIMTGVMGFFILYIFIFGISSVIMSLFTEDIATACSAVITSMSNVGPGFGEVGPMSNFAHLNDFAKIFLSILMMVGRLEIFTVLVLFSRSFWKR